MKRTNRYKILPIPQEAILNLFQEFGEMNKINKIRLPEGTISHTVHFDFETNEFLFLLENPAFPVIDEGMKIPRMLFSEEMVRNYQIKSVADVLGEDKGEYVSAERMEKIKKIEKAVLAIGGL